MGHIWVMDVVKNTTDRRKSHRSVVSRNELFELRQPIHDDVESGWGRVVGAPHHDEARTVRGNVEALWFVPVVE